MFRILFLHKDFPGQFLHLARHLAAQPGIEVRAMASDPISDVAGVHLHRYTVEIGADSRPHSYLFLADRAMWRGQTVLAHCVLLNRQGYRPDLIIGHNGWGELLFLKEIWPDVPLIGYFEFYYHAMGADVGFDPEFPVTVNDRARVRAMNTVNLLGLEAVDRGVSPTLWQRDLHPPSFRSKLALLHDGIDTDRARPGTAGPLILADGRVLDGSRPVITYVARHLEPYRGFHTLMRAAPAILARHPTADLVIVGSDGVFYGAPPADGGEWRERMLTELAGQLPMDRLHFTGPLAYDDFINLMRLSSLHLYLTYPFVLSWSMLEAMACGVTLLASATPPVMEVVTHGENGLLVPFPDPAALADAVSSALALPAATRAALGKAARRTVVERYDCDSIALPAWLSLLKAEAGLPV